MVGFRAISLHVKNDCKRISADGNIKDGWDFLLWEYLIFFLCRRGKQTSKQASSRLKQNQKGFYHKLSEMK
ncbi:hypothetical protein KFK09_012309 [Dendrobium nobile]|uniref:Uncharacterized protein n=1 Tax=Dendrobium nobile TaxID=94219 RepID=A0A8T3BHI1_DENNO|nr:hypothetical protein KFK09_012309 [Dendrobium nobile]